MTDKEKRRALIEFATTLQTRCFARDAAPGEICASAIAQLRKMLRTWIDQRQAE